jgi:hypothetical protein
MTGILVPETCWGNKTAYFFTSSWFFTDERYPTNAHKQFLLCLLVPLHVSAPRCHLQGVTVSLFISYSKLSISIVFVMISDSGSLPFTPFSVSLLWVNASTRVGRYSLIFRRLYTVATWCNCVRRMCVDCVAPQPARSQYTSSRYT